MHNVPIRHPERLQAWLRAFRAQHKTQTEAAKVLGISQSTFSRLLTGAIRDEMTYRTYASIRRALGAEPRLPGRPGTPTGFAVGLKHLDAAERARLETRVERIRRRRRAKGKTGAVHPQAVLDLEALVRYNRLQPFLDAIDEEGVWSNYEGWMDLELERLKPLAEPVLRALWEDSDTRESIADFLEDVSRSRDQLPSGDDRRCWLALCRVVEPFVTAAPATWGVERSLDDLSANELSDYLKAALDREELLLKPTDDVDRVRRGKPPSRAEYQALRELMASEEALFYDYYPSASPNDLHGWLHVRHAFFEAHPSATEHDWQALQVMYEAYFTDPPRLGWKDWEVVRNAQIEEEGTIGGYRARRQPGADRPWVPDLLELGPQRPGDRQDDG